MIQLIAITDDASTPPAPLHTVACGRLTAICGPADESSPGADSLWRHEELVESLMETRDLLPVRFGTQLSDDAAVAHAVSERGAQLAAQLERIRGAVELAVRVDDRGSGPRVETGPTSGREYMRSQAGRVRAGRMVHDELASLARDTVVLPGPEILRAAYLVERGGVDVFVTRVRRLQAANEELVLICTGPWPPYSFAEGRRS